MAKKPAKLSTKLPLTDNGTLPKADVLERWGALPTGKQLNPEAAPYGEKGSAYERDSIRVCGSLKFLDSVLSNLKGLLRHENTKTLLDINYAEQKEKGTSKRRPGQYTLYVQVKEKARTTRAKAASPAPARVKATKRTAQLSLDDKPATHYKHIEDAQIALTKLGYSPTEAQRRITAVTDKHGLTLTSEQYIKFALNHSK